ncbi:MAG: hypothetical protein ABIS03_09745, partial [Gemmatimonadaceae bacterium]
MFQVLLESGFLRVRVAFVIAAAGAFAAFFVLVRDGDSRQRMARHWKVFVMAAIAQLFIANVQLGAQTGQWLYEMIFGIVIWLLGWALYMIAEASTEPDATVDPGVAEPARVRLLSPTVIGIAAIAFAVIASSNFLVTGHGTVINDDMLYRLQSKLFFEPHFSVDLPAANKPFFMLSQAAYIDGRMFTQYPPGWPAIIHVFSLVGAGWWAAPVLLAGCVTQLFVLGARVYGRQVGFVAAGLLLLNPTFLGSTTSGGGSTFFLLLAACIMVSDSRFRWAWVVAGFSLGVVCAIRPLTGVTAGPSVLI